MGQPGDSYRYTIIIVNQRRLRLYCTTVNLLVFLLSHSVKTVVNVWEVSQIGNLNQGLVDWPTWVECLTHVSHVTTTLTSSTNIYIYAAKVIGYYGQNNN